MSHKQDGMVDIFHASVSHWMTNALPVSKKVCDRRWSSHGSAW